MADAPFKMWDYWMKKKGLTEALREYYPEELARNQKLQIALATMEINELAINTIMYAHSNGEDGQ